jgi:ornithine carbamoyltransferase
MGQEKQAKRRMRAFKGFQVNEALMSAAGSQAVFMHCLPAHRGLEVTDGVMDSPASVVFDQAETRLHAQKALLAMLIRRPGL